MILALPTPGTRFTARAEGTSRRPRAAAGKKARGASEPRGPGLQKFSARGSAPGLRALRWTPALQAGREQRGRHVGLKGASRASGLMLGSFAGDGTTGRFALKEGGSSGSR